MQNSLKKMFIVDGLTVLLKSQIHREYICRLEFSKQLAQKLISQQNKYIFYISKNRDNTEYTNK